ncbi:MAG: hypothetical protein CR986_04305 [Ignavibacteriae bacterium]|nr:MAG: hypothetical protein CR986_04305 [Ignavibacteriota bacterium]
MKKSLFVLIFIIFTICACSTQKEHGKFSYSPGTPKAGDEITITYNPDNPKIKSSDEISMEVYSFSESLDKTNLIDLTKKDNVWSGKVSTSDSTKGLLVQFKTDEAKDNNNELGYVIFLQNTDGNIVPGAYAGLASLYYRYSSFFKLNAARDSISNYFMKDFEKNKELKREYIADYISSIPRKEMKTETLLPFLEELEKEENLSQKDLENLSNAYRRLGNFQKSAKYLEMLENKYPKSDLLVEKFYQRFKNMLTPKKMMDVFTEFQSINPEHGFNNYMFASIINKYQAKSNYKKIDELFKKYNQYLKPRIYNTIAWKMYESKTDLPKAKELSLKGVELAREELNNLKKDQPEFYSEQDWQKSKETSLAMVLDTYANIEKELGNKENALKSFNEVVELTNKENSSLNENYFLFLYELGKNNEAKLFAEEIIKEGKSTGKIKESLGEIFINEGKSKEEFKKYLSGLEKTANEKLIKKLKDEMINKDAPAFELKDIEGNTVKLSDFKNKILILDFWATWCGPCLQSFPFMQKAVNNYKDDPNVKFLFVNTWERVDDKQKNVEEFLKRTKYPFHILLDNENIVVDAYKVQGIPTKFIIDGNGKIKFASTGLHGGKAEFLQELDLMINLAKENN